MPRRIKFVGRCVVYGSLTDGAVFRFSYPVNHSNHSGGGRELFLLNRILDGRDVFFDRTALLGGQLNLFEPLVRIRLRQWVGLRS